MWIGNIGKKSAAFINHKPFHPGNYQNQEKVWLAEQKLKEEQKKERELEERRREEVKIEELRRALRGEAKAAQQLQKKEEAVSPAEELRQKAREAARLQALHRKQQEAQQRLKQPAKSTLYDEDILTLGHTSVFGSFYSKQEDKWGYKCCGCLDRSAVCTANEENGHTRQKKRKSRIAVPSDTADIAISSVPGDEAAEDKALEAIGESNDMKSMPSDKNASEKFHVGRSKRRAREGGVAAYVRLLALPEEDD
ncbi:hypothetical protein, conserved [Eimeria tenella]|uniref:CBF1-interacting co-repressor CIR N-terminal domain-containing protein n=1 Tax=Eimeria tenella TaxID=5802 RepID=H9BA41_EIMTE|nr:hypothetical protein, conserved [Eimeria tenella]AET50851.1 hypothetical protein [Eimeria tenella]CDJ38989.1 hypothetical protein, conserved [Eimeria tenella]|eukprot:XP_013229744.1 hypothetical protein, conserved [Eimeria tenella]